VKFLLDHDVPDRIGQVLIHEGYGCTFLRDALSPEMDDQGVLDYACANGLVLLTCNRDDFLALSSHQGHAGIIIIVRRKNRIAECAALLRLIEKAGESGLVHNINFA